MGKKAKKTKKNALNHYINNKIKLISLSLIIIFITSVGCLSENKKLPQSKPIDINTPPAQISDPKNTDNHVQINKTPDKKSEKPIQSSKPKDTVLQSLNNKAAEILKEYVDEKGMVNYKKLRRQKLLLHDLLKDYHNLNADTYNSWCKNDKIAFWANAYNIQMLKIILENYPIKASRIRMILWPPKSIRHIKPVSEIGSKKWDGYKLIVMDEEFKLSDIEKRLLFNEFNDPRLVFILTQASNDSPQLRNEPYSGKKLEMQLKEQITNFLANPRAFRIDRNKGIVYLSAIFQPSWYGNDFLDKYRIDRKFKDHPSVLRAVLNFISPYISERDRSYLELKNYQVKYVKYDWRLNE